MTVGIVYRFEKVEVNKDSIVLFFCHTGKLCAEVLHKIASVSYIGERIGIDRVQKLFAHAAELGGLLFVIRNNKYNSEQY